jgi:hypothetical protein
MAANPRNLARLARYDGAKLGQGELTFACSRRTFAKLVYWLANAIFPRRLPLPSASYVHPSISPRSGKMRPSLVTIAALFLAVMTPESGRAQSPEPPALEGAVKQRLVLDKNLLKSLPTMTIDVTFEAGNGKSSGRYTGVLLWSVLEKAGLVDEPGKNANLKHTLLITGRDGYAVALAIGESVPSFLLYVGKVG